MEEYTQTGSVKTRKKEISFPKTSFLSLLSDSNQRPRDYKSRALAN
jgi:hypothetical protein